MSINRLGHKQKNFGHYFLNLPNIYHFIYIMVYTNLNLKTINTSVEGRSRILIIITDF